MIKTKKIPLGKYYAKDVLSDSTNNIFLCNVYCQENEESVKYFAELDNGLVFEVLQISEETFSLTIDEEHQYFLESEDSIISGN